MEAKGMKRCVALSAGAVPNSTAVTPVRAIVKASTRQSSHGADACEEERFGQE